MKDAFPPAGGPLDASVHPVVLAASQGVLPAWAAASEKRRAHMARVAGLLEEWVQKRGEADLTRIRWLAAAFLHDALRDEEPEKLLGQVDPNFRGLSGKVLHGPGAAFLLHRDGVQDRELLHAVAFHTLGSAEFQDLGFALFAADFLEPGRKIREDWRAELRERAPRELEAVVREVLSARIGYLLERGRPLHPETLAMWNRLSEGQPWASASEF